MKTLNERWWNLWLNLAVNVGDDWKSDSILCMGMHSQSNAYEDFDLT